MTKAPITQTYLFNEIVERLLKMNSERNYCNIYTKEVITIDGIVASINVYGEDNLNPIKKIAIDDLSDSGYPEDSARPTQFGKLAEYLDPKYWNQLQVV